MSVTWQTTFKSQKNRLLESKKLELDGKKFDWEGSTGFTVGRWFIPPTNAAIRESRNWIAKSQISPPPPENMLTLTPHHGGGRVERLLRHRRGLHAERLGGHLRGGLHGRRGRSKHVKETGGVGGARRFGSKEVDVRRRSLSAPNKDTVVSAEFNYKPPDISQPLRYAISQKKE